MLSECLFRAFASDISSSVDVHDFIASLAVLGGNDRTLSLQFIFRVYDLNGSGVIERAKVERLLLMAYGDRLKERVGGDSGGGDGTGGDKSGSDVNYGNDRGGNDRGGNNNRTGSNDRQGNDRAVGDRMNDVSRTGSDITRAQLQLDEIFSCKSNSHLSSGRNSQNYSQSNHGSQNNNNNGHSIGTSHSSSPQSTSSHHNNQNNVRNPKDSNNNQKNIPNNRNSQNISKNIPQNPKIIPSPYLHLKEFEQYLGPLDVLGGWVLAVLSVFTDPLPPKLLSLHTKYTPTNKTDELMLKYNITKSCCDHLREVFITKCSSIGVRLELTLDSWLAWTEGFLSRSLAKLLFNAKVRWNHDYSYCSCYFCYSCYLFLSLLSVAVILLFYYFYSCYSYCCYYFHYSYSFIVI